jgi:hypothetical protein
MKTEKQKLLVISIILTTIGSLSFAGTYSGGSGIETDPYLISTAADLHELAATSADWTGGKQFVLTKDITFLLGEFLNNPIGNDSLQFDGTFDGAGFCIRGLTLSGTDCQGLFGYTSGSAQIKDLGVEDATINCRSYGGILVGRKTGGTITNCYSTGSVSGQGDSSVNYLAGLVSFNISGTITDCYSTASVSGQGGSSADSLGGLVGKNYATISNCYSTGSVSGQGDTFVLYLGGLVGLNSSNGTITDCYSTGSVSGQADSVSDLGGLVGEDTGGTISATSFWNTETSGMAASDGGTGITTAQMKTRSTFDNPTAGWDFTDTWQMTEGVSFPYLHIGVGAPAAIEGDIDGDGDVDMTDFAKMANNWLVGTE